MPLVSDLLDAVERLAPPRFAFSFDKVGLQVGDPSTRLTGVLTTLDCSDACIDEALQAGANAIVSHHPLIFDPLGTLTPTGRTQKLCVRLVRDGIALIAAHTNWDCAPGGVNDALASVLGLGNVRPFGSSSESAMSKLVTFVPLESVDRVVDSLAAAGAGQIGDYDRCAFISTGKGTFRGNQSSNPVIGERGRIEDVDEAKVEMVVPTALLEPCLEALRSAHPYEEPAYDVFPVKGSGGHPIGRIGDLAGDVDWSSLEARVAESLGTVCRTWRPSNPTLVKTVAVVGGAGSDEWPNALKAGAGAFVTGEVKHHHGVEASEAGLLMIEAGHFETEQPGVVALAEALSERIAEVSVSCFP